MAKTYPVPFVETDNFYLGLDGQTDQKTGVTYPTRGSQGDAAEIQFGKLFEEQGKALAHSREGQVIKEGPTKIGVYPLEYKLNGTRKTFEGVTNRSITTADDTYLWYLDEANQIIESTTLPASPHVLLARVIVSAGVILSITDLRHQSLTDIRSDPGRVYQVDDTNVGVLALDYVLRGNRTSYAGTAGTAITTADDTYYWLLDELNELVESTTVPLTPHVMLAKVVVAGGVIASITDLRSEGAIQIWADPGRLYQVDATNIGVLGLEYTLGGTKKTYAGTAGTAITTTNDTYYWFLDETNTLAESTTVPSTPHVMLAKVVVAGSVISAITDLRDQSRFDIFTSDQVSGDFSPALEITLNGESGSLYQVFIQVQDAQGNDIQDYHLMRVWLADTATGGETSTPPTDVIAINNSIILAEHTASAHLLVVTDSSGTASIEIQEAGADTWYLRCEINGRVFTSGAIVMT